MAAGSSINPYTPRTDFATRVVATHEPALLATAATSISTGLVQNKPVPVDTASFPAELAAQCGSFVTLEKQSRLRGCIGTIQAYRPLIVDVSENAFGAAFRDPRFQPVEEVELADLTLSISVLSPMEPMSFNDEADLLDQLEPHQTGLLIRDQDRRAVFLPQVWESLPEKPQFLNKLKAKARLPESHWSDSFEAWRFQVAKTKAAGVADLLSPGENGPR